jgi:diaminohydroxyphosphoribosylaminopyrimidine deaminase/5-amino-6-(5-phosphoribosylamino)uracil reductase
MRRALRLAANSFATPNPGVGCVLVREKAVVGEGWTQPVGQAHAEVVALRAAGEQARGATAYVTLEPCCHWGRTPPCTDALIAAGVARVVAATTDKDPRVGGQGIAQLRAAGIEVMVGILEAEARRSNEAFFHFHETGLPFVTLKAAMSLDGKIATHTGSSQWITGTQARAYVHRLRAQSGAVIVGIGTLLADDAQLTARLAKGVAPRQPLRVVVDSKLRTPLDCRAVRLLRELPQAELLIATTQDAGVERERALRAAGAQIARLPSDSMGRVDLMALMVHLAQRKIISALVEGGGAFAAGLLESRLVHKVLFFVAPKLVGGRDAPTPLEGTGVAQMSDAVPLDGLRVQRFGPDIAIEGYVQAR